MEEPVSASKTKRLSKKKADKYFSEFIRKRDRHKPCITCGKITEHKDAGHFINRDREATRYDEKNVHGQCIECNRFKGGLQFEHGKAIDRLYGDGTAEGILIKSKMRCRRKAADYERIAKEYKDKVSKL